MEVSHQISGRVSSLALFQLQFIVIHPKTRNCFLQPAQGTVLLLFHLSIGSEYSPRARQTCRICYQDFLFWFLASPAQIPIHTTEKRHHFRQQLGRVSVCVTLWWLKKLGLHKFWFTVLIDSGPEFTGNSCTLWTCEH